MNSFSNLKKKEIKEKHWCFIALACLLIMLIEMFLLQVPLSPVWKKTQRFSLLLGETEVSVWIEVFKFCEVRDWAGLVDT